MPFTGRATYDTGVFDGIAEDVSDIIGMISPDETPLLDALGDANMAAQNVLHEWLEDDLSPNTLVTSATVSSANQNIQVAGGLGAFLQAGTVMKVKRTGEYIQLTATAANTITVTRGFGGTTAATIIAADEIFVISDAALEGADVNVDTSRPRTRLSNYTQIIKKDVIVSGTVQAVEMLGGIANEFDYQKQKKIREAVRDLEKMAIQGKVSANSIGSATAYRTAKGIWDHITTNSTSLTTLTPDNLDSIIEDAWEAGAQDLDIIVVDNLFKRAIDRFQDSRVRVMQDAAGSFKRQVMTYSGTYGTQRVVLSRWMPANSLMVLSSQRIKVLPLRGRSFSFQMVAKTGDSDKGMVIGEYTTEVKNANGLARAYLG